MNAKQSSSNQVIAEDPEESVSPKALSNDKSKRITAITNQKTLRLSRKFSTAGFSPIIDRRNSQVLASQSVDQLPTFSFLTSLPAEELVEHIKSKKQVEKARAQSGLVSRYERELQHKMEAIAARKRLDKILYNQQKTAK